MRFNCVFLGWTLSQTKICPWIRGLGIKASCDERTECKSFTNSDFKNSLHKEPEAPPSSWQETHWDLPPRHICLQAKFAPKWICLPGSKGHIGVALRRETHCCATARDSMHLCPDQPSRQHSAFEKGQAIDLTKIVVWLQGSAWWLSFNACESSH